MKSLVAVIFATVYGLLIRVLFGFMGTFFSIMSITFLILIPVFLGFLTIILQPKNKHINWAFAFFAPWITSFVILIVTTLINLEGAICWLMIFPLFAILAGIGGVIAKWLLINYKKSSDSNFGKPTKLNISLLLVVPIAVGALEGERTLTPEILTIKKEIVISASPEKVWKELTNTTINVPAEKHSGLSKILGFPAHLSTTLDTLAIGGKRLATYENGLYFEETITQFEKERLLVLKIHTDPNKIPPTVLDEHIVIGGKHVDILEDVYSLEKTEEGKTKVTLSSQFMINTPFNWYAGIWSDYLMEDILDSELELIKARTEIGQ